MLYLGQAVTAETSAGVRAAVAAAEAALGEDLVDLVPSYASLLILYDPLRTDHLSVARRMRGALHNPRHRHVEVAQPGRTVVLPVYYAAEAGADLESLAARAGLPVQEVIALHTGTEYRVHAIGFAPGFAYLGEVDERIAAPRLATPRARVPRGSVAIAERQTAVYPADSPGGWNLIGRCPVPLFDRDAQSRSAEPCMPIAVGDSVRFEAIDRARFLALGGDLS